MGRDSMLLTEANDISTKKSMLQDMEARYSTYFDKIQDRLEK